MEDSDTDWALLWRENDYLWQPIIEPGLSDVVQVTNVTVYDQVGNIAAASGPQRAHVYSSGGCGIGGVVSPSDPTTPSSKWPCAYGTPARTGELNIGVMAGIDPTGGRTALNDELTLVMRKEPAPTAKQPRVVVTAIASVEWQQIDGSANKIKLGDNPAVSGGGSSGGSGGTSNNGKRCFPEKDSPNGAVNNLIDVKITLAAPIPAGMTGKVYFELFDPDNPLVVDKNDTEEDDENRPDDNWGSASTIGVTTFVGGQDEKKEFVSFVSAHAGDNYIVAAHQNAGVLSRYRFATDGVTLEYSVSTTNGTEWKPLDDDHQTPILTVWRTLHAECDVMPFPAYPGIAKDEFVHKEVEYVKNQCL